MPFLGNKGINAAAAMPIFRSFRMPDTPFLPPFTGHIVTGSGSVSAKLQADGGIAYIITFETVEPPALIASWYKGAFQLYDWKLDTANQRFSLSARHGNNAETRVFMMSSKKVGVSTQVQLYYRYIGKDI
jgi:hypothetical protein